MENQEIDNDGDVKTKVARVTSESRGAYMVKDDMGEYRAKITGKHIFGASSREDYPAVGDWVKIEVLNKEQAVIREILPRRTILKRKIGDRSRSGQQSQMQIIAANIDTAFIVESVDRDYSLNRFERYFAMAKEGGVEPVMVLNKTDLLSPEALAEKMSELKKRFDGVLVIAANTLAKDGIADLRAHINKDKTYCFLGSSGVGKSSIINKLLGEDIVKTGEVSDSSDRGKHTTTSRQMYFLENGGIVIDNPGIREVGLASAVHELDEVFDEISSLSKKCKYSDCTHTHEPGCAVLEAQQSGKLDDDKYSNYQNMKKEAEFYEMSEDERRQKEKKFGKMVNTAKKILKNDKNPRTY